MILEIAARQMLRVGIAALLASTSAAAAASCAGQVAGPVRIAAVTRHGDFGLDDGRTVRLAGILLPQEGPAAEAWRGRLATLAGEDVALAAIGAGTDRWGRNVASILVGKNLSAAWDVFPQRASTDAEGASDVMMLEELLVRNGLARVWPQYGVKDCIPALLTAETEARREVRGLWREAEHAVRQADDLEALAALAGRFAVVEGIVVSVGERSARTYLNFGRRWSEDMTVTVSKPIWRIMRAAGLTAASLEGRRVRVRGVVELRGGPLIEVTRAEDVERIEVAGTE